MNEKKNFYTLAEIRRLVYSNNVSKSTIQTLVKRKVIPSYRVMSKILVPAWWLEQQINSNFKNVEITNDKMVLCKKINELNNDVLVKIGCYYADMAIAT